MSDVLILTYDFPPYNSVGAQRPYSWFHYFKEFEIEPVVITRQWGDDIQNPIDYIRSSTVQDKTIEETDAGTIISVPFKPNFRDKLLLKYGQSRYVLFRKFLTLLFLIGEYLLFSLDNRKQIFKIANQYIKNNKVDCIIATGEPFILFKYASILSKRYRIPWIADYRDGWTSNYSIDSYSFGERVIKKRIIRRFEKQYIRSSRLITTVSEFLASNISVIHKGREVNVIMNGYDSEILKFERPKNKKFTIAYAGTIYPHQRLEIFLDAAKEFKEQIGEPIELIFYGVEFYPDHANRLCSYASMLNIEVKTTPRLPKESVRKKLSEADVLLLLANDSIDGSCAKVFEYLALKKHIILCVNDNATLKQILINTNAGAICDSMSDVYNDMLIRYKEWKQNGFVACYSKNIEKYSRKEQTKKLAELIHNISSF